MKNGLVARAENDVGILMTEESRQVADLGLRLPRAGRGAKDNEGVKVLDLTQPRNRRQTTLVFGGGKVLYASCSFSQSAISGRYL